MLPQARTRLFALAVSAPVGKLGLLRLPERQRPVADSLVPNVFERIALAIGELELLRLPERQRPVADLAMQARLDPVVVMARL